jgi:hypothetical protein
MNKQTNVVTIMPAANIGALIAKGQDTIKAQGKAWKDISIALYQGLDTSGLVDTAQYTEYNRRTKNFLAGFEEGKEYNAAKAGLSSGRQAAGIKAPREEALPDEAAQMAKEAATKAATERKRKSVALAKAKKELGAKALDTEVAARAKELLAEAKEKTTAESKQAIAREKYWTAIAADNIKIHECALSDDKDFNNELMLRNSAIIMYIKAHGAK